MQAMLRFCSAVLALALVDPAQADLCDGGGHYKEPEQPYHKAVFKICAKRPDGSAVAIGTASLIDGRGVFLTAKHLMKEDDKRSFVLVNPQNRLEIGQIKLLHFEKDLYAPDFALFEPAAPLQLPDVPVLTVGHDSKVSDAELSVLGFPLDRVSAQMIEVGKVEIVSYGNYYKLIIAASNDGVSGMSGSPLLSDDGVVYGVFYGRPNTFRDLIIDSTTYDGLTSDKQGALQSHAEHGSMLMYPISAWSNVFYEKLPPSRRVKEFLSGLRNSDKPADFLNRQNPKDSTPLDYWHIYNELVKNLKTYHLNDSAVVLAFSGLVAKGTSYDIQKEILDRIWNVSLCSR